MRRQKVSKAVVVEVVSKGLARSEPQAAEKLAFTMVLCQGTTSVVPQVLQNMVGL
jgi:hypothetical protein